ncbi:MAG: ABC transporter permease [Candidatus Hodarchaeota archaeon]
MKVIDLKVVFFNLRWSLKRMWALLRNEIEFMLKDKQSLLIVFLLPIGILIPFWAPPSDGSAADEGDGGLLSLNDAVQMVGVLDLDTTTSANFSGNLSESFIESMVNTSIIMENEIDVYPLTSLSHGNDLLRNSIIIGYVVIDDLFEENLTERKLTHVTIVSDATDVETAASLTALLETTIIVFKLQYGFMNDEIFPIPESRFAAESPIFEFGPLIFSIMIFGSALLLSTQCIVGDEPLKRTLLTPAAKMEIIIAKTMAYSAIHAVQIQLLLLVAMFVFRLPVYCPFHVAFTVLFLVAFSGVMIGMFVSVLSKTRLQANQMFLLIFIVTLLSLIFISDPAILDWLPMYQGISGFNSAAYKGFDYADKPWPFLSLSIISVIFFVLVIVSFYFKKTLE